MVAKVLEAIGIRGRAWRKSAVAVRRMSIFEGIEGRLAGIEIIEVMESSLDVKM